MNGDVTAVQLEYAGRPDRDILLELVLGQRVQNGTLIRLVTDVYGDDERGIVGLTKQSIENTEFRKNIKAVFITLSAFVSLIGIANLIAILTIAK